MKNLLLIPLRFLILFFLIVLVICGYSLLMQSARFPYTQDNSILSNILLNAKAGFFIGYFASVFILLLSIVRMQGNRGAALFILFITASPIFIFAYNALVQNSVVASELPLIHSDDAEAILNYEGGGLHFTGLQGGSLESLVLYNYENRIQRTFTNENSPEYDSIPVDSESLVLRFFPSVLYEEQSDTLVFPQIENLRIPFSEIDNTVHALYPTVFMQSIESAIREIPVTINRYAENITLSYILLVCVLTLYVLSLTVFLRLSRWPYINITIALVFLTGGLYATRIMDIESVQDSIRSIVSFQFLPYVVPLFIAIISLIFAIISIFNPRKKEWIREMNA